MVIFLEITGGSNGIWSLSARISCSVYLPGGRSSTVSVWPAAEVQVGAIVGDRLVHGRQVGVDEQVMMPGIGLVDPGRRHSHVAQAEPDLERALHHLAVVRPADIEIGVLGCRRRLRLRRRQMGTGGRARPAPAEILALFFSVLEGRPCYGTMTVICCETIDGSNGTWSASPRISCSVCRPGGSSILTSVWPPPK